MRDIICLGLGAVVRLKRRHMLQVMAQNHSGVGDPNWRGGDPLTWGYPGEILGKSWG